MRIVRCAILNATAQPNRVPPRPKIVSESRMLVTIHGTRGTYSVKEIQRRCAQSDLALPNHSFIGRDFDEAHATTTKTNQGIPAGVSLDGSNERSENRWRVSILPHKSGCHRVCIKDILYGATFRRRMHVSIVIHK